MTDDDNGDKKRPKDLRGTLSNDNDEENAADILKEERQRDDKEWTPLTDTSDNSLSIVSNSIQRGLPRVEDTEVTVLQIRRSVEEKGIDVEVVAEAHGITIGQVYEALAWAHKNPREMVKARQIEKELREDVVGKRTGSEDVDPVAHKHRETIREEAEKDNDSDWRGGFGTLPEDEAEELERIVIGDDESSDEPLVPKEVLDAINNLAEGNTATKEEIEAALKFTNENGDEIESPTPEEALEENSEAGEL